MEDPTGAILAQPSTTSLGQYRPSRIFHLDTFLTLQGRSSLHNHLSRGYSLSCEYWPQVIRASWHMFDTLHKVQVGRICCRILDPQHFHDNAISGHTNEKLGNDYAVQWSVLTR